MANHTIRADFKVSDECYAKATSKARARMQWARMTNNAKMARVLNRFHMSIRASYSPYWARLNGVK